MLENSKAFAGFSTNNLQQAKEFYGKTLGLKITETPMGILELHIAGCLPVIIYPKETHEPATFTVLNFVVNDIEKTVTEIISKGIEMEKYPGFDQDQRGISKNEEGPHIAWFKDPAGNILSVLQEKY